MPVGIHISGEMRITTDVLEESGLMDEDRYVALFPCSLLLFVCVCVCVCVRVGASLLCPYACVNFTATAKVIFQTLESDPEHAVDLQGRV